MESQVSEKKRSKNKCLQINSITPKYFFDKKSILVDLVYDPEQDKNVS